MRIATALVALALVAGCAPDPSLGEVLIRRDVIEPGAECPYGGTAVHAGADADGDGALDDDEIEETEVLCDPEEPEAPPAILTRLDEIPAGDVCPNGGTAVHTGADDDADGVLDDDEIDDTIEVCSPDEIFEGDFTSSDWDDPDRVAALESARVVTGTLHISVDAPLVLPKLELVAGDLRQTGFGADVSLPALVQVVGAVYVGTDAGSPVLSAPVLTEIGGDVTYDVVFGGALEMPMLESIGGDVYFWLTQLQSLQLDALAEIGGSVTIQGAGVAQLELPALHTLGGELRVQGSSSITSIELPVLETLGELYLSGVEELVQLEVPALTTVTGDFLIDDAPQLSSLVLPALSSVGNDMFISSEALTTFEAPVLVEVGSDGPGDEWAVSLAIGYTELSQLSLPSLETVGGGVLLRTNTALTAVDLPELATVHHLDFFQCPLLQSIQVPSVVETEAVYLVENGAVTALDMPALERVVYLDLRSTMLTDLSGLLSLEWVGAVYLHDMDHLTSLSGPTHLATVSHLEVADCDALVDFEGLESLIAITQLLRIWDNPALDSFAGLSGLTQIGGDVEIVGNSGLSSVDGLDELRTINGSLIIQANSTLVDLDGLGELTWVGGTVQIASNPLLPASEIAELEAQLGP